MEGSTRKLGDRARISVQLWDTNSGAQLWAERYDRDMQEIFAVQDEVTRKVVSIIMGRVAQADYRRGLRLSENELAAYDCWLRGQHLMSTWNPESNREDFLWFERADFLGEADGATRFSGDQGAALSLRLG